MQRIFLAVGLLLLAAMALPPNRAEAAALPVPAGIQAAIQDSSMIHEATYACRRIWSCGPYGCGTRRVCSYYRPYYRPYYYRPYYRPYHWHRPYRYRW